MPIDLLQRTRRLLERHLRMAERATREKKTYDASLGEMVTNLARAVATFAAQERLREAHEIKKDALRPEQREAAVREYLSGLPHDQRKIFRQFMDELDATENRL